MPKVKESSKLKFKNKLIENFESRYLEPDLTGGGKKGKKILGHLSYVALCPDDIEGVAEILTNILFDEANAAKLAGYKSGKKSQRDQIQQELFPAQKLFPTEYIFEQRKRTADDLAKIALGLMKFMAAPEGVMEPTAAAAATPSSSERSV